MKELFKALLTLDLQYFAEDEGLPVDELEVDEAAAEEQKQDVKTFTQQDVNNLIAKETKAAQEKLLKQAGVTDFANLKEGMAKFKEWQESQKTEAQKQAEQLASTTESYSKLQAEYTALKENLAAMKVEIKEDSIQDALLLARAYVNDETDIEAALKLVKDKYPQFGKQEEVQQKPLYGTQPAPPKTGELDPFEAVLAKYK